MSFIVIVDYKVRLDKQKNTRVINYSPVVLYSYTWDLFYASCGSCRPICHKSFQACIVTSTKSLQSLLPLTKKWRRILFKCPT